MAIEAILGCMIRMRLLYVAPRSTVAWRQFITGRVHGLPKEEVAIMEVIIKCLAILQVNVLYVQLMQG